MTDTQNTERNGSSYLKSAIPYLVMMLLIILLVGVSLLYIKYLRSPAPFRELVRPGTGAETAPHYLFSIYGVNQPVGVALSPDGERIYVSESGGNREIKIFERDGSSIGAFSPGGTQTGERAPVYIAVNQDNRVYVSDRSQHTVFIYDEQGKPLDALISPGMTLSEYVNQFASVSLPDTAWQYNIFQDTIDIAIGDNFDHIPHSESSRSVWAPLGIRFSANGTMFITDARTNQNSVHMDIRGTKSVFGQSGEGLGQLLFPNAAMPDLRGRVYVSDGNNGRISVWDRDGTFIYHLGTGTGNSSVSLPRGLYVDHWDWLYVVDAVAHDVKVYDVSGYFPEFLFTFGGPGMDKGLFNYPNDIFVDLSGRLYIADRENNRVQVWSY